MLQVLTTMITSYFGNGHARHFHAHMLVTEHLITMEDYPEASERLQ